MDKNDIFKISCPVCGSVIQASKKINYQGKGIRCPICKELSPFSAYKIIGGYVEDCTEYGGRSTEPGTDRTEYGGEGNTVYGPPTPGGGTKLPPPPPNTKVGTLIDSATGATYPLMPGRNVIGRQASQSQATLQIPCSDNHMSREHIVIDVVKIDGYKIIHKLSLAKQRINATFVSGNKLDYGDVVNLEDGMVIKLPGRDLRFKL